MSTPWSRPRLLCRAIREPVVTWFWPMPDGLRNSVTPNSVGRRLRKLLKQGLDRDALRLYAQVDDDERAARIADCEGWLIDHPDHGGLLQALGFLYLQDRQYDKARHCLEKSLDQQPDGEAYAALGRIHDRSGSPGGSSPVLSQCAAPEPGPRRDTATTTQLKGGEGERG